MRRLLHAGFFTPAVPARILHGLLPAAGVLLLAALVAGLLWRRRRQKLQQQRDKQQVDRSHSHDPLPAAEQLSKSASSTTGRSAAVTAATVCVTSDDSAMEAGLLNNRCAMQQQGIAMQPNVANQLLALWH